VSNITRDDIIRMAREAGATEWCPGWHLWTVELERFFHAAYAAGATAGREACAKVCEKKCVAAIRTLTGEQHDRP